MVHNYTLYIDEAGDDKVDRLKPEHADGNSEWFCMGGYLIRAEFDSDVERRRDEIVRSIGGTAGQTLHYRNLSASSRLTSTTLLAAKSNPARGFVICSYKKTLVGYQNDKVGSANANPRDMLYNFVCRLLLERVTHYVADDAKWRGTNKPLLKIVMASRKGHHFGRFKAYISQLVAQSIAKSTYLNTREINASVLRQDHINRAPASQVSGLQLADVLVSSFFQSIEQNSPYFSEKPACLLRPLMAVRKAETGHSQSCANEGVTLYPAAKVSALLTGEQQEFFSFFGYDFDRLGRRSGREGATVKLKAT